MRAHEIMEDVSSGGSGTGSVAVVVQPMGMQTRQGGSFFSGIRSTDLTPNTPKAYKKNKQSQAKFQNSR
jgi:hypothetical protein